jgi:hypothetical protein
MPESYVYHLFFFGHLETGGLALRTSAALHIAVAFEVANEQEPTKMRCFYQKQKFKFQDSDCGELQETCLR